MFELKYPLADVFILQEVVTWEGAVVEIADAVVIHTPPAAWAYAAAFPCRALGAGNSTAPLLIEVNLTVTAGQVGVGCLTADQGYFLDESFHGQEDGPTTVWLRLDSLEDCGWLMIRNGDAGGPSCATVTSVRVFRAKDDPAQQLYIFDHIFKTGGTTFLQSFLRAGFRETEYVILRPMLSENAADRSDLESLSEDEMRTLQVVGGHNAGLLRRCFPGARFLTLIRDPTARVISAYLHARFHADSLAIIGEYLEEHNIGLQEFVENDLFAARSEQGFTVHNGQAKALFGADFSLADLNEKAILQAIQSRFWLVGHTEALERFVFYLHWAAGFPLVLFNNRLVRGTQGLQVTAQDLETIKRLNQADEIVYRVARKEFDRRVEAIWSDEIEQDHRWYMDRLRSFREATGGDYNIMRLLRWCPPQRVEESRRAAAEQLP